MKSGRHPNSEALDRAARAVARHGPREAIFIADSIVAAALDVEIDRLNAARGPKRVTAGEPSGAATPRPRKGGA